MSSINLTELKRRRCPICAHHDLPAKHVFDTQLLGQELADWQGLSAEVNIWENRSPHRGMRLTMGARLGSELRCAHHGYRFAQGPGVYTSVPAQPERLSPRSMCIKLYPKTVAETGGPQDNFCL